MTSESMTPAEKALHVLMGGQFSHGSVAVPGHTIHYVEGGIGHPLLLIHGINMGWGQWYPNLGALASKFRVIAVDLPGAGRSSFFSARDRDFPEALVTSLREFIQAKGLSVAHVLGHSLGAWLALRLSLAKDISGKLVLANPLGFSRKTPSRYRPLGIRPVAQALSRTVVRPTLRNVGTFAESVMHRKNVLSPRFVEYYYEALLRGNEHPFIWINRFSGIQKVRAPFDLRRDISGITTPTLVVAGEFDPVIPPSREHMEMFDRIPGAEIVVIPGTGHVPSTEQPAVFNEAVISFLVP